MNGFILQESHALAWLIAVPVLLGLGLLGLALHRSALRRFLAEGMGRSRASSGSTAMRMAKFALASIAAAAIVLALARPGFNPQPRKIQRTGRDVMFVIDVSRSMLAQDVRPSRLERAKLGVRDVLDAAEGDRIGIVAFAGAAVLKCPLTTDYSFVRLSLDDTTPDSIGRGGTAIGEALRFATSQLVPDNESSKDGRSRTIFLITDGEDHEADPVEAARDAAKRGVRIVALGIGSELAGAPVPAATDPQSGRPPQHATMEYDGHEVVSKMDSGILKRVAEATDGGVFLNVGTGNIDLDTVYKRLMRAAPATARESTDSIRYTELFQALLGLALLCMLMESIIDAWYR